MPLVDASPATVGVVSNVELWQKAMALLSASAARLAWPDLPLRPGEVTAVRMMGRWGDEDFVVTVEVHRGVQLVRHVTFAGWDAVGFLLAWFDTVTE